MTEVAFRTSICSVVFVDIVDYSKASVDRQVAMKADLNDAIRMGLINAHEDELIVLDAGDGAAICFFGDPEDALFAATAISGGLRGKLRLRTGINLGPVKIVTDLNGNRNVVGDAINVAQRIMSFADEQEVLISRPYFEVVSCLRDDNTFSFQALGVRKDKHVREHQVYAVGAVNKDDLRSEEQPTPIDETDLPAELVEQCRARLVQIVGPIAGRVVERAASRARSPEDFVTSLADSIASDADRRAFVSAMGNHSRPPSAADEPTQETSSGEIEADLIKRATAALATSIGPIAEPLVRRAAAKATSPQAFLAALSLHIEDNVARDRFLNAMTD